MRIILDRALFDVQSGAEAHALVALLSTAVDDTHDHALQTDPVYVPGSDNEETDRWLSQRSSFEARPFRAYLEKGNIIAAGTRSAPASGPRVPPYLHAAQPRSWHLPGPLEIRVKRRAMSDWGNRVLTLGDAADLLREPVHLVLENARTEPAFVGHLAGPTNGATLRAVVDRPGRIETHGGGGGEAKRWIEALTDGASTPAKWRRMLRAWVLFDQDAGDPDARAPSASAVKLMSTCEQVVSVLGDGLSWICLRRREIESYVPDSGLLAESPSAPHTVFVRQVISWRANHALAPHAWALDLKRGLRGDILSALPLADRAALKAGTMTLATPMLRLPFSGLTLAEVRALDLGLGDRLGEALRATPARAWTADLPTEYDRGPLDQVPRALFVQSLFDRM